MEALPAAVGLEVRAVAGELDRSPATVTETFKRLDGEGLVDYEPYEGVTLTEAGRRLATLTDTAAVGLNYLPYRLTVDPDGREVLERETREEQVEYTTADDGNLYLPPGTYVLEVSRGRATHRATLHVRAVEEDGAEAGPDAEALERQLGKG